MADVKAADAPEPEEFFAFPAPPIEKALRFPQDEAGDTYAALASPDVYLLCTDQFGWTAERFRAVAHRRFSEAASRSRPLVRYSSRCFEQRTSRRPLSERAATLRRPT
jgi:hypothetical protein